MKSAVAGFQLAALGFLAQKWAFSRIHRSALGQRHPCRARSVCASACAALCCECGKAMLFKLLVAQLRARLRSSAVHTCSSLGAFGTAGALKQVSMKGLVRGEGLCRHRCRSEGNRPSMQEQARGALARASRAACVTSGARDQNPMVALMRRGAPPGRGPRLAVAARKGRQHLGCFWGSAWALFAAVYTSARSADSAFVGAPTPQGSRPITVCTCARCVDGVVF